MLFLLNDEAVLMELSAAIGIGALAPGPGRGIAVWSLPNFAALQVRGVALCELRHCQDDFTCDI